MSSPDEIARRGELTKRYLLELFEWLAGKPWNVDSQRKMADLLRAEGEERPPSQGLVSHALRFGEPKAYPTSQWFAERVAALHEHVLSSLEDRPALAEMLGGRGLVVPPRYDPADAIRFAGGRLEEAGDVVLLPGEGIPVRGAVVWVPAGMVGFCDVCGRPFLRRAWNALRCSDPCRREARRRRRKQLGGQDDHRGGA